MNIELLSTAVVDAQTESIEFDGLVTNECPVCDKVCRTTPSNHTHNDSFAYMLCVGCNLIWELNRPEHKIWTDIRMFKLSITTNRSQEERAALALLLGVK